MYLLGGYTDVRAGNTLSLSPDETAAQLRDTLLAFADSVDPRVLPSSSRNSWVSEAMSRHVAASATSSDSETRSTSHAANDEVTHTEHCDASEHQAARHEATCGGDGVRVPAFTQGRDRGWRPTSSAGSAEPEVDPDVIHALDLTGVTMSRQEPWM